MQFQTDRLQVHAMSEADRDAVAALLTDPVVGKTYMVPDFSCRAEAERLFERLRDLSADPNRYVAGIYRCGTLIGMVNETYREGNTVELGYAFLPRYHNQGYGTEMLSAAIRYFFAYGFDTVLTAAFEENGASLRVMEKCGMRKTGQTEDLEYRGTVHTCIYYAAEKAQTRKYYEAYDERYLQVHDKSLQWFDSNPSPIVGQVMGTYGITPQHRILELGCGEGRDAAALLQQGYNVTATDISPAAIAFCKQKYKDYVNSFAVLDCVAGRWSEQYDFIYAVAVVHMLVEDADRSGFYRFVREHLRSNGLALICTMGDGTEHRSSDPSTAFLRQERVHEQTGTALQLAGTSCRMVTTATFAAELCANDLDILEQGLTAVEPDFPVMMYAVVKSKG